MVRALQPYTFLTVGVFLLGVVVYTCAKYMTTPSKFGRYEIKSELGRGGMATVYRAYDPSFDREVAIKVLPREMLHDPQFRSRFERELKIVAGLEHPAIVPVYDVGDEDGQPYFVMRYMNGGSLSSQIERGAFSLQDAARIISRIAEGLAYAHRKKIVHRDLKPDNILFDENGDPFISDFGIAKLAEGATGNLTGSGIIGTPAYMSPEQAQGDPIDSRSDVYALGVIAYQMLSGERPYHADTPMGVAIKHITEPVPEILKVMPSLPVEVDTVIKNSMAKERDKRYSSTTDLAKNLNISAFGHEFPTLTPPSTAALKRSEASTLNLPPRRRRTGWILAGGLVLALLVAGFVFRDQIPGLAAPTATSTATNTAVPPTPTTAPTETALPTATIVTFAAFCQPDTQQIEVPVVRDTNIDCVQKIPFTTVSIPLGASFEVVDPGMTCELTTTREDDQLISCTGQQLYSYDLKVCSHRPDFPEAGGQCAEGDGFDTANACCMKPPAEDAGCTIYQVDMKSCGS
jgi:serine/threonine protein kinase